MEVKLVHIVILFITYVVSTFLFKLYHARRRFVILQRDGLPMPPHHPILGHLPLLKTIKEKLPPDSHGHYLPSAIRREIPDLGPMFYIDVWPFADPMLIVASPSGAYQITQEHSLPKHPALRKFIHPITGSNDMLTLEGDLWKTWRGVFNPGFSVGHLMKLVPDIMKDVSTFCDILREHVNNDDLFLLDEVTIKMTMDVIGRATFNTELNSQTSENKMVSALHSQTAWLKSGADTAFLSYFNPLRPLVHWYNTRIMDRYLSQRLETHFATRKNGSHGGMVKHNNNKSVIDLALDTYLAEAQTNAKATETSLDATFKSFAISQIKIFIFAGHDTTSGTICYILYLLSSSPAALARVRAEHDQVLGTDHSQAVSKINSHPHLLNQLLYTTAVIKEALRLFPPASSVRSGEPGFHITDETGRTFPTDGFFIWSNSQAIQRDSAYWPQPNVFLPERWLVGPGDPLNPPRGAWRPFEFGPRNCIGQELAMLEMKCVVAMVAREFEIHAAFAEWDRAHPPKGPTTVDGERAYQILLGGAHPSERFPCRVSLRKN